MRQLATVQLIEEVLPIEGADSIEKVRVKGWWCVAKKDEFRVNDLCVYFEIDSLLPESNPYFSFLSKGTKVKTMEVEGKVYKGYRLKTIRLRGQVSQGLALPMHPLLPADLVGLYAKIGTDVSDLFEVVKYEPPIPAELAGKVKGSFPSFLRKTDEERIQNCADVLQKYVGQMFYVTEKLDGTSATYYKKDGEFGVCSRNLELLETEGNTFWRLARESFLASALPNDFAIQGEIVGESIQGNPLKLKGQHFYAYNVFNIAEQRFLDFPEFLEFCLKLGVDTVPIIDFEFMWNESFTLDAALSYANSHSVFGDSIAREGVVIRPHKETRAILNGVESRLSFKVISNEYLLKENA